MTTNHDSYITVPAKSFAVSKTVWANLIGVVLSVLQYAGYLFPPEWNAVLPAVIAILNIILRFLTGQPIVLDTPGTEREVRMAIKR